MSPDRLHERLAALEEIAFALGQPLDLDGLFRVVYEGVARTLDATIFLFGLVDETSQTVEVVGQVDSGTVLPKGSFPLGTGFVSKVIRTREPLLIRHWSTEGPRVQVLYGTEQGELHLPESCVTVPIVAGEAVLGVLSAQSYRPEAYDETDVLALRIVADVVGVALRGLAPSKGLEDELRQRLSELEVILASMTDALVLFDVEGRIARLNHAARTHLRLEDHMVVLGRPLTPDEWRHWRADARAVAEGLHAMIEAVRTGTSLSEVEVGLAPAGRRVLSFSGAPLRDAAGGVRGGVIVFRDVTERRAAHRVREELLSIASHDLKTPAAAMKGQVQLLRRRLGAATVEPETLAGALARIEAEVDRLASMLDVLLDLSLVELGQLKLARGEVDLVALARTVAGRVESTSERHRIVVAGVARAEGLWDERRLEQVLQNVLANAVKYSPEGGTIRVTVEADEASATVCVRDEGVGIAPDELPHVFERFYRTSGTRRLQGSGLGLHISREIVAAHGGRIWAESAGLGRGSTFCVSFPGARASAPA